MPTFCLPFVNCPLFDQLPLNCEMSTKFVPDFVHLFEFCPPFSPICVGVSVHLFWALYPPFCNHFVHLYDHFDLCPVPLSPIVHLFEFCPRCPPFSPICPPFFTTFSTFFGTTFLSFDHFVHLFHQFYR